MPPHQNTPKARYPCGEVAMKHYCIGISFIIITSLPVITADYGSIEKDWTRVDPRILVTPGDEGNFLLAPNIGKRIIENLLLSQGEIHTTTSARLENKRIVDKVDLQSALLDLAQKGYALKDREVRNVAAEARTGTFTFYGVSLKFQESKHLPKTSIKMRLRTYIYDDGNGVKRSPGFLENMFLELKIKNPYPEYPLSVHKYRILIPDEEVLMLIKANPARQFTFYRLIHDLIKKAHERDLERKQTHLINALYESIMLLGIANNNFIKPHVAIAYFRVSKKYDEEYEEKIKKSTWGRRKAQREKKVRSYEITIDDTIKAFTPTIKPTDQGLDIESYFLPQATCLIAQFPTDCRIVEFKQPDAIGYDGPGRFRRPEKMSNAQRALWQALVKNLSEKALAKTRPDSGKYSHVKEFLRINNNIARETDQTVLYKN